MSEERSATSLSISGTPFRGTSSVSEGRVAGNATGRSVLIVGGSTRAAAWSAVRAGWRPICADLFADLDTRQVAEIVPVRDFPNSLPEDVAHVQADGWFYTGGLENHPDIIERMQRPGATYGSLWGTAPPGLRRVRDPFWLAETLRAAGLPALKVLPESTPPPADGTWLQKPLASAGGRAIRVWDRDAASRDCHEPHYFQSRPGSFPSDASSIESYGAIFFADNEAVAWQGVTQGQVGLASSRAPQPFSYCGSTGLIAFPEPVRLMLQGMAETLARAGGIVGLFGIDFLIDGGTPWIVEINPRYTASVEVLELQQRRSLLRILDAAGSLMPGQNDHEPPQPHDPQPRISKIVLYASQPFVASDFSRLLHGDPWSVPCIADVPVEGTLIEAGWPICTVFGNEGQSRFGNDRQSDFEDDEQRGPFDRRELDGLSPRIDTIWKQYVDPAANRFRNSTQQI